ncbi:MAG TPA: hypothetical protein VES73_16100 [Lamprocystis sp. (in: g-proteobacteria)]|nr:hypothetical protein [Lamprocystis sp. (in: g-proteobacteria)]
MLQDIDGRATVDDMLRTAQQNQLALTGLADQKANIVLGLTFLLTTLTATRFAQGEFPPALLMLLVSSIAAALFALATLIPSSAVVRRPRAKEGAPARNPLFFGGIAAFDYPDYRVRTHGRGHALQRERLRRDHRGTSCRRLGLAAQVSVAPIQLCRPDDRTGAERPDLAGPLSDRLTPTVAGTIPDGEGRAEPRYSATLGSVRCPMKMGSPCR